MIKRRKKEREPTSTTDKGGCPCAGRKRRLLGRCTIFIRSALTRFLVPTFFRVSYSIIDPVYKGNTKCISTQRLGKSVYSLLLYDHFEEMVWYQLATLMSHWKLNILLIILLTPYNNLLEKCSIYVYNKPAIF